MREVGVFSLVQIDEALWRGVRTCTQEREGRTKCKHHVWYFVVLYMDTLTHSRVDSKETAHRGSLHLWVRILLCSHSPFTSPFTGEQVNLKRSSSLGSPAPATHRHLRRRSLCRSPHSSRWRTGSYHGMPRTFEGGKGREREIHD